ncbi:MAG: prefoldin alpha subunit [Thermoproteota archaeon]|nr:prefoldin alpha subunit [Thermoproteota archaeon]
MSQNEEALRRLVLELQILEGTADTLQTRLNFVNAAITELQMANETIEGLKKEEVGAQILMPIGGGSYLKARLDDTKNLIVGIGADVSTERDVDSAQNDVGSRILEFDKARTAVQQQLNEVSIQMSRLQNQIRAMSERQSEGKENV